VAPEIVRDSTVGVRKCQHNGFDGTPDGKGSSAVGELAPEAQDTLTTSGNYDLSVNTGNGHVRLARTLSGQNHMEETWLRGTPGMDVLRWSVGATAIRQESTRLRINITCNNSEQTNCPFPERSVASLQ